MKRAVVFGSDHHNALGVVKSLGFEGVKISFILSTPDNPSISSAFRSKYVDNVYRGSNLNELTNSLEIIKKIYGDDKVVVYTACDTSAKLLSEYKERYKDDHVVSFFAEYNGLGLVDIMDKDLMMSLAHQCGFLLPRSIQICLQEFSQNQSILDTFDIVYPCITKPNKSVEGSKNDIIICNTREELVQALTDIPNQCQKVLIQEYIKKDFEMSIIGVSTLNSNQIIIPGIIKKIREYPFNMGSSSYSVYMDKFNSFFDKTIIDKFIQLINYKGLFSIEFLYSNEKLYFLEINLRNDGNGFIPTRCGFNLPYYWYLDVQGVDLPNITELKFKDHYFMIEIGDIMHVIKRKISLYKWIKCLFITDTFMVLSGGDRAPFYFKLKNIISRKLRFNRQ